MKATYIDYSDTLSFSETLLSYLAKDAKLEPFISCWPEIDNFGQLISARKDFANRDVLVKVLRQQYSERGFQTPESEAVIRNIESLSQPDTFTVTTGHQLNIFTGPLYFIFKIVTAINLAKELKLRYPDKNFVPVYWMATEDHDFAEINYTKVRGQKFSWNIETTGATGRINPNSIQNTLRAYANSLGLSAYSEHLSSLLQEAYLKHDTLAEATRYLVHGLFASHGLVVSDADHAGLKKAFSGIIKQDIVGQKSHKAITETSALLNEKGFDTQVHAREINFFYLKDNLRERIVFENNRWEVLNTAISFNQPELLAEIDQYPERFSPNVVMRPLYQEVILPNLAYIGGGAEIVYWLQLKQNFDQFGISFPALVPRNSALVATESISKKLERLQLRITDLFKSADLIKKEWVVAHSSHTLNLHDELKEFDSTFENLKKRAAAIDSTLAPSTEAVKARLHKALSNLEQKLIKAEKRNHENALSQIDQLRSKYFPGNGLQERTENFGLLYSQYGQEFINELIRHFKPLDFKFTILEA